MFQWLDAHLRNRQLHTITRDEIQAIVEGQEAKLERTAAMEAMKHLRGVSGQVG